MKKFITIISALALIPNADLMAAPQAYLSGKIGATRFQDVNDTPTSLALSGAFGAVIGANKILSWRGELEVGTQNYNKQFEYVSDEHWQMTKLDRTIETYLVNGYVDFMKGFRLRPYVGAGLGFAKFNSESQEQCSYDASSISKCGQTNGGSQNPVFRERSDFETSFMYGVGGGVGIDITKNLKADVGARILLTKIYDENFRLLNATIGLRYEF
ncbi:MAG: outer membrane beta-barrel protein [Rickettsiales bacterium]|jgi:opacity protein-like surface antigen|nr:outer membrane beta-barrel protein [Rickettsiales bacterium]